MLATSRVSAGIKVAVIPAVVMFLMVLTATPHLYAAYVWGEASATVVTTGGLKGYWEYCISVGWDVTQYPEGAHGASHVSILLELEECLADCGDACFVFPDTVGVGSGEDGRLVA